MRVLLAGSTGVIGSQIHILLREAGHTVICPTRAQGVDTLLPATLNGICHQADAVVSAMGGTVSLSAAERRPYAQTNTAANSNLLAEATRAGVRRFLYVAAHAQPAYAETAYIRSHETFAEQLSQSGLSFTILRPTAIFDALIPFVHFARKGIVPLIGDGSRRTNPISARDVARIAVDHLATGPANVSLGGPDILTRRRIAELAAGHHKPVYLSAPPAIARMNSRIVGAFHPRLGELIAFAAAVSTTDCIAPPLGRDTLADFFAGL